MIEFVYGREYWRTKKKIKATEYLSVNEQKQDQLIQLKDLVAYSIKYVPFYKEHYGHIKESSENYLECFRQIPFLGKDEIRRNKNAFIAKSRWKGIRKNTGGSTGEPFEFFLDRFVSRQREKAFIFDQWRRVGYKPGALIFNLRGSLPKDGAFVKRDHLFNIHSASSLDLSSETIHRYVEYLNTTKPLFLHGYPSTMFQLASLIDANNLAIDFEPKAVFCGSEKLFPYQREIISKIFGCRVFNWYGHSEYQVLASECEFSNKLHVYPQYGYTELIPTGQKNECGQEIQEIVATGFNNRFMPFLRYRTRDYAILADDQKCECGRQYTLFDEVIGRVQEFIVDGNENLISVTPVIYGQHYQLFENIIEFQILQKKVGEIEILIDSKSDIPEKKINSFAGQIEKLLGNRLKVRAYFVDEIEKSKIGKKKTVLQSLNIENYM